MNAKQEMERQLREIDPNFTVKQIGHLQWECRAIIDGVAEVTKGLNDLLAMNAMIGKAKAK